MDPAKYNDPDWVWLSQKVVNNFFRRQTEFDRYSSDMIHGNYAWKIPYASLRTGRAESFLLLKQDYGDCCYNLRSALEIEKRLYDKFGLGLLSPREWAYVYAHASFCGFDGASIAKNLHLGQRYGSTDIEITKLHPRDKHTFRYWSEKREYYKRTDLKAFLKSGVAFSLSEHRSGFSMVTMRADDYCRLRLGVADEKRFSAAIEEILSSRNDDNFRDWI